MYTFSGYSTLPAHTVFSLPFTAIYSFVLVIKLRVSWNVVDDCGGAGVEVGRGGALPPLHPPGTCPASVPVYFSTRGITHALESADTVA